MPRESAHCTRALPCPTSPRTALLPSNHPRIYAQRHALQIHYDLNYGRASPPHDASEATAR